MTTPSNDNNRILAILAYLVPVLGGIVALIAGGKSTFTKRHAGNTLAMPILILLTFIAWIVVGYVIAIIPVPFVGPIIVVALFALVMIVTAYCLILWVSGLWSAITGKTASQSIPLVSKISKMIAK